MKGLIDSQSEIDCTQKLGTGKVCNYSALFAEIIKPTLTLEIEYKPCVFPSSYWLSIHHLILQF